MPALSFEVVSGAACTGEADSGAYYAYLQQINGKHVQASRRFDLGTVIPVSQDGAGLIEVVDELLAEVSSDQRTQVVAANV